MTASSPRAGNVTRAVLLVAFMLLAVPMLLISLAFLGWRATAARANEQDQAIAAERRAVLAAAEQEPIQLDTAVDHRGPTESPNTPDGEWRAVMETEYRTEEVEIKQPVRNPETGVIELKNSTVIRRVPVTRQRFIRAGVVNGHDPMVARLVGELREMDEEDKNQDRKLSELKQRLELEFANMHEQQEKEIEQTEARLDALKKLHQQRGENRDKIVQRRIDELLGRSDALQWEIVSSQKLPAIAESEDRSTQTFGPPQTWVRPAPPPAAGTAPGQADPRTLRPQFFGWDPFGPPPPKDHPDLAPTPVAPVAPFAPVAPAAPRPPVAGRPQLGGLPGSGAVFIEERVFLDHQSGPRPGDSSSTISRIFELARKTGAARSALESSELELEQSEDARRRGLLSNTGFQQMRARHDQLQREVQLNQLELEALTDSMLRSQQFAEEQFKSLQEALDGVKNQFATGLAPNSEVLRAQQELNQARKELEQAEANLKQLKQASAILIPDAPETESETGIDFTSDEEELRGDKEDEVAP